MRNIILALILANLLMLGWKQWIAPAEVGDPMRFMGQTGEVREPQLVLYSPARSKPQTDAERPELVPAVSAMNCERIGPFDNPEPAAAIATQLGARGHTVDLARETGSIWVGHWVQVTDLETDANARKSVARLVEAGINDAYIVRTDPTIDISLGVFRGEAGAGRAEQLARKAGMKPARSDRFRAGTQHWVNVELRGSQALDLTDLELQWSQILRAETVACRPTADTIADTGADSLESVAEVGDGESTE